MAKQTKSAAAPAPAKIKTATPTNPPTTGGKPTREPNKADRFTRVLDKTTGKGVEPKNADGTSKKLAPQCNVILNLLETAGEAGMTRGELCEKLPAAGLVTRQPVGRIVSYYQKDLVNYGTVMLTKGAPAAA